MRVAITGSSGMVGRALADALRQRGDEVVRVVRSFRNVSARERVVVWQPDKGQIEATKLEGLDAVVHLAGETIAGVWTSRKKRAIYESRVKGTTLLARTLADRRRKPAVLISMSGVNYYGSDRGDEPLTEESSPGTGFMAEVAIAWEQSAGAVREAGIRVVHPRTAPIFSPRGGILKTLLPLFRLGLGAQLGSGEQYAPWIALDDVVRAFLLFLDRSDLTGPVNLVAPDLVTNAELTAELARAVNRPSVLKAPAFALKLAPGGMGQELLLGGLKVIPRVLQDAGFAWSHPRLRDALRAMLG
ncbi:MAG: TIGR01777 family protein [Candidatus Cloacimonetes bacterium]|nr:TIGR01777 family protein [Candidatus Cloacimonadota bacterium]